MTLINFVFVKFLVHLAYKGTDFNGWQRQKNTSDTIQENIERNLSILMKEEIGVFGCGRTDKGVHALQYFAHFTSNNIQPNLIYKLNRMLPKDICVYDISPVAESFNARYSARSRTYRYFFHLNKNVFTKDLSTLISCDNLFLDEMIQCIKLIQNSNDFGAFSKTPDKVDNTICKIKECNLYADDEKTRFCFEITSNRFLRGMVRIIMYRLLKVLDGSMSVDSFKEYLQSNRSKDAVQFAYPQGLYLYQLEYPEFQKPVESKLSEVLIEQMKCIS